MAAQMRAVIKQQLHQIEQLQASLAAAAQQADVAASVGGAEIEAASAAKEGLAERLEKCEDAEAKMAEAARVAQAKLDAEMTANRMKTAEVHQLRAMVGELEAGREQLRGRAEENELRLSQHSAELVDSAR